MTTNAKDLSLLGGVLSTDDHPLKLSGEGQFKHVLSGGFGLHVQNWTGSDNGIYIGSANDAGARFIGTAEYRGSGVYTAKDTESSMIDFYGGNIRFYTHEGLTPGNNFVRAERLKLDSEGFLYFSQDNGHLKYTSKSGQSSIFIGRGNTNFYFYDYGNAIIPVHSDGTDRLNVIDLGATWARYKRTFLSDYLDISANGNAVRIGDWDGANMRLESSGRPLFITSYDGGMKFGIDNTPKVFLTEAGNFGVGLSDPAVRFQVEENTSESIAFRFGNSGGTSAYLSFYNSFSTNPWDAKIGTSGTDLRFGTSNVDRVVIDSLGKVEHNVGDGYVKRSYFITASSNFNNPSIPIVLNVTATSSHQQISIHLKMQGIGLSANRTQYSEFLYTAVLDSGNLTSVAVNNITHSTLNQVVAAGVFSTAGNNVYFVPNRQTNYDVYVIEAQVMCRGVSFEIG